MTWLLWFPWFLLLHILSMLPTPEPALVPDHGPDEPLLYYKSHSPCGPSQNTTVLLIHGACTSGVDWDLVAPHLAHTYHVLIPDLPGHGRSRNITPFSVAYSSRLLAQLIRRKAINGKAHIVGHSLGAHIAIDLASSYPAVVDSVFVSGFEKFPPTAMTAFLPFGMWADHHVQKLIPRFIIRWLMDGTDIQRGEPGSCTLGLCQQLAPTMLDTTWPDTWPARTLIVAAGKKGILPTADHPEDAVRLMEIGRGRNEDTVAVTHKEMRHPWNRQDPKLFAETARTWFEKGEIVDGFEKL
jgi:pimeloyl-ACP methyl ester carboxylesterase